MASKASGFNVILLANQPRIFREVLHRTLDGMQESQLVLEVVDLKRLPQILERVQASWLVVSLTANSRIPEAVRKLIDTYPLLSILGVSLDGSLIEILASDPNGKRSRSVHRDMTLAELLEVVRFKLQPSGA